MLCMRVRGHGGTSRSDLSLAEPSLLRQRNFFGTRLPRRPQTHLPPLRRRCPTTLQTRDTTLATAVRCPLTFNHSNGRSLGRRTFEDLWRADGEDRLSSSLLGT